ncbi:MAG TPA: hypothetical protein V6D20_21280, partial [Candidatus Obscuribacterales bacterium]
PSPRTVALKDAAKGLCFSEIATNCFGVLELHPETGPTPESSGGEGEIESGADRLKADWL